MAPESIIHQFLISSFETINPWEMENLLESAAEHAPLDFNNSRSPIIFLICFLLNSVWSYDFLIWLIHDVVGLSLIFLLSYQVAPHFAMTWFLAMSAPKRILVVLFWASWQICPHIFLLASSFAIFVIISKLFSTWSSSITLLRLSLVQIKEIVSFRDDTSFLQEFGP